MKVHFHFDDGTVCIVGPHTADDTGIPADPKLRRAIYNILKKHMLMYERLVLSVDDRLVINPALMSILERSSTTHPAAAAAATRPARP